VPDENTICKFRHLMERYNLGDELFRIVNVYLEEVGMKVSRGTIVDATIINAPSSTKNRDKQGIRNSAPNGRDFTQHKGSRYRQLSDRQRSRNRNESRVPAKVEHVFRVMKRQFGFSEVRYRGLAKNAHFLFLNCALINLVMGKRRLLRLSQARCV
jgi:IS5 family transposase